MKRFIIFLGAILMIQQGSIEAQDYSKQKTIIDTSKVVNWVTKNAIPIHSVDTNSENSDLDKLAPIFNNKKVIAMGDASHGTKEFFVLKQRMIEYLVKNMNCTAIALEIPIDAGVHINQYVRTGEGDIDQILKKQAWWWHKSYEIRDFLVWMKEYNMLLPDDKRISFYGFDCQANGDNTFQIFQYFKRVDENYDETIQPLLDFMAELYIYDYNIFTPYRIEKYDNTIITLQNIFEANREKYIAKSSNTEYLLTKARLNTFAGIVEMSKPYLLFPSLGVRDKINTENIRIMSDIIGDDNKMVVWAHNGHIASDGYLMQEFFRLDTSDGFYEVNRVPKEYITGYLLREEFGERFLNIGFEFYEGSFTAIEYERAPKEFTVSAPESNTLPFLLNKPQINSNCYFIGLDSDKMDKTTLEYFNAEQYCHEIGAAYVSRYVKKVPIKSYDAIIFFRQTTASRLLDR